MGWARDLTVQVVRLLGAVTLARSTDATRIRADLFAGHDAGNSLY